MWKKYTEAWCIKNLNVFQRSLCFSLNSNVGISFRDTLPYENQMKIGKKEEKTIFVIHTVFSKEKSKPSSRYIIVWLFFDMFFDCSVAVDSN